MTASHLPRNLPIIASILVQNIARFIRVMRPPGLKRDFWRIWKGCARRAGAGSWAMFSICARRAVYLSFSRERLDYPASALSGDGAARHWQINLDHPFSDGFANGWIKKISLGYIHSVTDYDKPLPWLRYPHQIERTTSSLTLGFPEIGFSLLPSLRFEQISSQSRNRFDEFDETRFSVSFSKAF